MFLNWNHVNLNELQAKHQIIGDFRRYGIVQEKVPSSSHDYPKTIGAYLILHLSSGLSYVGSHGNLYSRKHQHNHLLKNNIHYSKLFQYAYNDDDMLIMFNIVTTTREEAYDIEQKILEKYMPLGLLFNTATDARLALLNAKVSEETRQKLSVAAKGRKQSPEWVIKRTSHLKGRKLSPEVIDKIKASAIERGIDPNLTKAAALVTSISIMGDGVKYDSIAHAARVTGLCSSSITKRVLSKNFPNWVYTDPTKNTFY